MMHRTAVSLSSSWSPQQRCFRNLLVAVRSAYYHDRAKLFWARHRVRVEFYKYATIQGSNNNNSHGVDESSSSISVANVADGSVALQLQQQQQPPLNENDETIKALVGIGNEVAAFIKQHMEFSVQRVVEHNETMAKLPVEDAKKFRQRYLQLEEEHESWCKTRIKTIMRRRPPPPYPFC